MTEQEVNNLIAQGQAEFKDPLPVQQPTQQEPSALDAFIPILSLIRRPHRHRTTAPTITPKTFIDQIQLYDDGTNRRLYLYVNGTWRYVALT